VTTRTSGTPRSCSTSSVPCRRSSCTPAALIARPVVIAHLHGGVGVDASRSLSWAASGSLSEALEVTRPLVRGRAQCQPGLPVCKVCPTRWGADDPVRRNRLHLPGRRTGHTRDCSAPVMVTTKGAVAGRNVCRPPTGDRPRPRELPTPGSGIGRPGRSAGIQS